ncbi:contractile injection system protein, VgrG/Pvc8 family, partial [Paenibacillus plantiphilus]|uniref:contractile injection system protein, VgrG/Pvc8 family n=1 Tax=Paenibacillus plantiphilus TaxID=2905650 RepID=UPI001F18C51A
MATWYQGDGFQLKWPYPLKAVRSLRIDRKFNEHATCSFTAMMAEEDAEACIRNGSFEDSLMIRKPGEVRDEHWFAGGITSIDIQMEDGIPHVQIEAISRTYAMDMKPVSRSYQNKGLTYTEVIGQLSEKYPKGDAQNVATNPGDSIGELIVQYQETDWQFMKRLASRIGTVILPDVVMDAARVYFGVPDLSWGTVIKSKRYAMIRNCDTYMEIKAHAEGGSADAMRVTDFTSYRVVTEQYCQVGDDVQFKGSMWVVSESVITYQNGMLQYEYLLVQRQSLRRKARLNKAIQGVSLEGRVVKRANNMVKVHLDIDDGHDEQGNWWFPYSPEGNNIFHCLPDEGARIKVYFPSGKEKKAIAVNAVRGGSEEMKAKKVFQKPTTKVFEMPSNAKMELGEDGVLFKQGTVSFHMDQNNIRVKASEDLLVVASNNLNLSGSGAVIDSIKMEATSIAMQTKLDQYIYIE